MKRKILASALCAITAATCAFGLTACNNDNGIPEPTALENAYKNYSVTQNMTVSVTDSRIVKYGEDYSTLVKVDYGHKTAYSKSIYTHIDNLNITHRTTRESYYEITDKPGFTIYNIYTESDEDDGYANWDIIDRSDLFDDERLSYYDSQTEYEINLLTNWVDSYIPSHAFLDTVWRATENDDNSAGLNILLNSFTESASGYAADVYLCINSDGGFIPYACNVTIKLDAQDRFESVVLDFGTNGNITAEYTYGTTTVTVPEEAKNSNQHN
ncbi:MAG: hypothetical protein K2J83_07035 [Clostridia bacterium]|nr:hypothetical protein [Clostridia bacterium]